MWKFISNGPNTNESQGEATEICDDKFQKKKENMNKNHPRILFREIGKIFQLTIGGNHLMN